MKKIMLIFLILVMAIISNCSNNVKSTKGDDSGPEYSIGNIPEKCIEGNNDFSINLFRTLNTEDGDKNIFISPVSASFALGMTMNGAGGNTYDEMKSTLGFNDLDLDEINATYAALIDELYSASDGVEFNLANSIWHRNDFVAIADEFKTVNENYFNAKVEGLNFNDAQNTLNTINGWVEDQTSGKIKNLIKEIDPNAVMFLINAIYFNASWKYQFDENNTIDDWFLPGDGSSQGCKMMNIKSKFSFLEGGDYDALELPYANENYSMLLVRPRFEDINEMVENIDMDFIKNIIESLAQDSITISVPKIEVEYEKKLNDILIEMGMKDAFDADDADFPKMFESIPGGIWIEMVKQKAFLKINEAGTEAAAATVVQMNYESAVDEEKYMSFNSPFLFFIIEKQSNTILFCGKIIDLAA